MHCSSSSWDACTFSEGKLGSESQVSINFAFFAVKKKNVQEITAKNCDFLLKYFFARVKKCTK